MLETAREPSDITYPYTTGVPSSSADTPAPRDNGTVDPAKIEMALVEMEMMTDVL
jgi:hypothetical protein